jgi:ribosomal protein L27
VSKDVLYSHEMMRSGARCLEARGEIERAREEKKRLAVKKTGGKVLREGQILIHYSIVLYQ